MGTEPGFSKEGHSPRICEMSTSERGARRSDFKLRIVKTVLEKEGKAGGQKVPWFRHRLGLQTKGLELRHLN